MERDRLRFNALIRPGCIRYAALSRYRCVRPAAEDERSLERGNGMQMREEEEEEGHGFGAETEWPERIYWSRASLRPDLARSRDHTMLKTEDSSTLRPPLRFWSGSPRRVIPLGRCKASGCVSSCDKQRGPIKVGGNSFSVLARDLAYIECD